MPSLRDRRTAVGNLPTLEGPCFPARRALHNEILLETAAKNGRTCAPPAQAPFPLPLGNSPLQNQISNQSWTLGSWSPRNVAAKSALRNRNQAPLKSSKLNSSTNGMVTPTKSNQISRVEAVLKENKSTPKRNSTYSSPQNRQPPIKLSPFSQKLKHLGNIKVPKPDSGLLYLFSKQEHDAAAACFKKLGLFSDHGVEKKESEPNSDFHFSPSGFPTSCSTTPGFEASIDRRQLAVKSNSFNYPARGAREALSEAKGKKVSVSWSNISSPTWGVSAGNKQQIESISTVVKNMEQTLAGLSIHDSPQQVAPPPTPDLSRTPFCFDGDSFVAGGVNVNLLAARLDKIQQKTLDQ